MHFEVLVEDLSGSIALEHILEKILGPNYSEHSWRIHPYKGKGELPSNLYGAPNPKNQLLLNNLPTLLRGFGKSLDDSSSVVVVVDLDDDDCLKFKQELLNVLNIPAILFPELCSESPSRRSEAWLLGDRASVTGSLSPTRIHAVLNTYVQDKHLWHVGSPWPTPSIQEGSSPLEGLGIPGCRDGEVQMGPWKCAPHMDM